MARIILRFKKGFLKENGLEKAFSHKYIKRIPKLTGKGWNYIYKETFQKPIKALQEFFGLSEKKLDSDYEKNNIQKDYGADKKTFASHVLEFFTNKTKWTNLFSKKEAQEKYKKPVKQSDVNKKASEKGSEKPGNKDNKKGEKTSFINRSLMRKVWSIYSTEGKAVAAAEETEKAKEIKEIATKGQAQERSDELDNLVKQIKARWNYIQDFQENVIDLAYKKESLKENADKEIIKKMLEEDRKDKKKVLSIIKNTDKSTLTASDIDVIWDTVTQIFSKKVDRTVIDIVSPEEKILNIALQSVQNSKYDRENERSNESIVKLLEADLHYRMQHREDEGDEVADKVLENYIESFKHNRELKWEENAINTAIKFIEDNNPHEIVCRAKVGEKKIGISVIVVENNDGVSVQMVSVFKIKDPKNLIKSHGFGLRNKKMPLAHPFTPESTKGMACKNAL